MTAGSVAVPMVIPVRVPRPGKPKSSIDTNTRIALCSTGNSDVDMFYTLNGTRPEYSPIKKYADFCTNAYRGPFFLPSGKVTLKALAVSKDGQKESNIVTKTFDVEYSPQNQTISTNDDGKGLDFQEEIAQEKAMLEKKRSIKNLHLSGRSAFSGSPTPKNTTYTMSKADVSDEKKPILNGKFLEELFQNRNENAKDDPTGLIQSYNVQTIADQLSALEWRGVPEPRKPPTNIKEMFRLQRDADVLKCVNCFADRPADPSAKFCNACGKEVPPLPLNKLPRPEPEQMGLCVYCKSLVPFNTQKCLVCEGPIRIQNQPKATIKLTDRLVCKTCGTANPSNLNQCVVCDTKLKARTNLQPFYENENMTNTKLDSKFIKCSKCLRINHADARFCDWCGHKPSLSSYIKCNRCGSSNHLSSTYCSSCAALIEPPHRNVGNELSESMTTVINDDDIHFSSRCKVSIGTQTIGLFYPSQRHLKTKEMEDERRVAYEKWLKDRHPIMTGISPGRGFWRKQVDHICQHLKVHAQNCPEFRSILAEPRMGKLLNGAVNQDAHELSLTLNFKLCRPSSKKSLTNCRSIESANSELQEADALETSRSESSQVSGETSDTSISTRGSKKKEHLKSKYLHSKLSDIDRALFKQISAKGAGSIKEVQRLMNAGANPNCTNKKGNSVLYVAVKNKHKDCIPIIVQAGANINKRGPVSRMCNTVLHEAVNLGKSGSMVVSVLLMCGADVTIKNNRGETPQDLAIKLGYQQIITQLMSNIGKTQLDKFLRSKTLQID